MSCGCNDKCSGSNPNPALQLTVENPPVLFHKVIYPASLGDDTTVDVENLGYKNILLVFEANDHAYLYSSDGVPTFISMGTVDTAELDQKIAELGGKLAEETATRIQDVANLQTNINLEVMAREADRDNLQTNINENAEAVDNLQSQLNTLSESTEEQLSSLDSTIESLDDAVVQKDTAVSADASTITLTKTTGELRADGTETEMPLPVASETSAGVMNAATYNAIQENSENIDSILSGAVLIENLPASPTQAELTSQWEAATGKTSLVNRASIYDKTNGKIWYYYTNVSEWEPADIQNPEVNISQATNDSLGIVKGSTEDGQVAVEADGSMSLNGFDALKSDVEHLSSEVDGIVVPKVPKTLLVPGTYFAFDHGNGLPQHQELYMGYYTFDTGTGKQSGSKTRTQVPTATETFDGVMSATDKSKLDSLLAIKSLNDSLELDENGQLSVVNSGSDVNLLSTYTTTVGDNDVYNSAYVNNRLDSLRVCLGLNATDSTSSSTQGAVVIGNKAAISSSTSTAAVAIGDNAKVGSYSASSVTIGSSALADTSTNGGSVAIGAGTQVKGDYAIVIGFQAKANFGDYSPGGGYASRGVAIGMSSSVQNHGSVALGSSSTTSRVGEVSIGTGGEDSGTSYSKKYGTRYLANVKAGELDTDAVNLKQMQDYVAEQIGDVATALETLTTGAGV